MRHRVLLVREWNAGMPGGCCGGASAGIGAEGGAREAPASVRAEVHAMAAVYLALRRRWSGDEVEITVADPRNMVWLLPTVWRDGRRRGLSRRQAWHQTRRVARNAVVVDGEVVFTGTPPHPAEAVAIVGAALARG